MVLAKDHAGRASAAGLSEIFPRVWGISTNAPEATNKPVHTEALSMRRHHEEFAAASSILPALSMLVPLAGALWVRIKMARKTDHKQQKEDV